MLEGLEVFFLTPPLGPEQGRNSSTPRNTRGWRIKNYSLHLPPGPHPGLMIIKQGLITQGLAKQLPGTTTDEVIKCSCWAGVQAFLGQSRVGEARTGRTRELQGFSLPLLPRAQGTGLSDH